MFSEGNLHTYGTPLPMLELDAVPSKKPVYPQDQIATDDQGRRRFHGAFTGGFSAGYWNTVGSKEGWTPQTFKSSRSEKAGKLQQQRPEDFMDDEDRGEFGIAPKEIRINEDFESSEYAEGRKRKFLQPDLKPIPGEPVLQQLLKPVRDKAAVRILKTWGWRPGQGVGPRQTRKEKKKARERNKKELYLMEKYGCDLPGTSSTMLANLNSDDADESESDSEEDDDEITFAPEDCELPPIDVKKDRYGLGYTPLSRDSVLGGSSQAYSQAKEHFNLFKPLEVLGKNNQKISFAGQAFGVGALEEDDDEDVYATDDLKRYDFSLASKKQGKKSNSKGKTDDNELIYGEFILDRNPPKPPFFKIDIPFGWKPRNWLEKKSRFEPLDPRKARNIERRFGEDTEVEVTREKRAQLLGEELRKTEISDGPSTSSVKASSSIASSKPSIEQLQREHKQRNEKTKSLLEKIASRSTNFTKGGIITMEGDENHLTSTEQEDFSSSFKPFSNNPQKQERYDKFLESNLSKESEIEEFLKGIQPVELSLWDRQMELKEFIQAKKLYKPLKGVMSDRFVTESELKADQKIIEKEKEENKPIIVERSKVMWKPNSLLCKRYNIAEPFGGTMEDNKKPKRHTKMSVFDYLDTSVNRKEDFQTPVIIPKNLERPLEMVQQPAVNVADNQTQMDSSTNLEWQNVIEGKQVDVSPVKKPTSAFKPKTDLEKRVVETMNKPITEKKELFRAIFSDSESDEDDNDVQIVENDAEINEEAKQELLNKLTKPVNAAAANLLRNNSPPRGIFKALFSSTTQNVMEEKSKVPETNKSNETAAASKIPQQNDKPKITFQPKSLRNTKKEDELSSAETDAYGPEPNAYGPALPRVAAIATPSEEQPAAAQSSSLDDKLLNLWQKHKPKAKLEDVWIEKQQSVIISSDSESSSSDDSTSEEDRSYKHKKKAKKTKKKKTSSTEHKHKKHKEHKSSSKKMKKHEKKKKKHKKK